jgi:hypothetical protein
LYWTPPAPPPPGALLVVIELALDPAPPPPATTNTFAVEAKALKGIRKLSKLIKKNFFILEKGFIAECLLN